MARIPFDLAQVPGVDARGLGGQIDTPQAGNKDIGSAFGGLADNLQRGAQAVDSYADMQRQQNVAALTASSSFTPAFLSMKQNAPPGAQGFTEQVGQAYDQHIADTTNNIEDPLVRMDVKRNLLDRKQGYVDEAAGYEAQSNEQNQKSVAGVALGAITTNLRSTVQMSPMSAQQEYNRAGQDSAALIDSLSGLDGDTRTAMKISQLHSLTAEYVQGTLMNAQNSGDLARANALMNSPSISNNMDPQSYKSMQRFSWMLGRSFARREGAGIASAVSGINQRLNAGLPVGMDEIKQIEADPALQRNPGAQFHLAEAKAKVEVNAAFGRSSIPDLRNAAAENMQAARTFGAPSMVGDVPPQIATAITKAAGATGCSPDYLAALTHSEYGSLLNSGDFGQGPTNGGSARGVGQIQPGTWLDLVKGNADAFGQSMQPPMSGQQLLSKGDGDLLALRSDPTLNLMGAGLYAQQNRAMLSQTLGRPANDAETYAAHVLGPTGGARFLAAVQSNPDAAAQSVVGADAAKANPGLFYDRNGSPLSCQQAYSNLAANFANSPARASFVKAQQVQRLLKTAVQKYSADPAGYAMQQGAKGMAPLSDDPATWVQRGVAVSAFAQEQGAIGINGRRLPPMQPFTNQEAQTYATQLANPDVPTDQKLSVLANVQRFADPTIIRTAYKQIGMKDPVAGLAGQLMADNGDAGTAEAILDGRTHINKNPALLTQLGATPVNTGKAFMSYVGGAASALAPDVSGHDMGGVAMDAAVAHYVNKTYTLGAGNLTNGWASRSATQFNASLDAAFGGTATHKAIQNVNGEPTIMTSGVNAEDMEGFLSKATPADLLRVSANGSPPMLAGTVTHPSRPVTSADLANATLRARGGDYYMVILNGGNTLRSGAVTNNSAPVYYMKLTTDTLHNGASGAIGPQVTSLAQGDPSGKEPLAQEDISDEAAAKDGDPTPTAGVVQQVQPDIADEMEDQQLMDMPE